MKTNQRYYLLFIILCCIALSLTVSLFRQPLLIWNTTSSLPKGFYRITPGYGVGDIVAFDIPENFRSLVQERGWIPLYDRLLKRIVGRAGDVICIKEGVISLNGETFGKNSPADSLGRPMPQLEGCHTVQAGHVWVMLKDNPLSLDSRYFGQVDEATIVGKARLVWGYNW